MDHAPTSVEELCERLQALAGGGERVDLFIPFTLTLRGRPIALLDPAGVAMALVGDTALGLGLWPDGFTEQPTGRTYHYRPAA